MFLGPWKETLIEPFLVLHTGLTGDEVKLYEKGLKLEKIMKVKGWPASAGVVEGRARVVMESKEIAELSPGEILVCPHTSPAWTPGFAVIKGVVTDQGGMMSHAAIVSREYKIPAVVGTWTGTQVIKTGDLIRVDGDKGIVTILKR